MDGLDLVLVGAGGALGALARFALGRLITRRSGEGFPFATFLINITGALLLGVVSGMDLPKSAYLLLGDGFLGAYTTFSTFMYEGFNLFRGNKRRNAAVYILGSFATGVAGYFIGFALGGQLS